MSDQMHVRRRTACRKMLMDEGHTEQNADKWIVAWEAEAERIGKERTPDYWRDGRAWIAEQLKTRKAP